MRSYSWVLFQGGRRIRVALLLLYSTACYGESHGRRGAHYCRTPCTWSIFLYTSAKSATTMAYVKY